MFFYATPELLHECKAMVTLMLFWSILHSEREARTASDYKKNVEKIRDSYMHHENIAIALARSEILSTSFQTALDDITFEEEGKYIRFVD